MLPTAGEPETLQEFSRVVVYSSLKNSFKIMQVSQRYDLLKVMETPLSSPVSSETARSFLCDEERT
jgi:hypothetical protein